MELRPDQQAILRHVRDRACMAGWVVRPSGESAHVWGAMVRKGLLRSETDSMNPIHEPPSKWTIYYLTDAGRAALATMGDQNDD